MRGSGLILLIVLVTVFAGCTKGETKATAPVTSSQAPTATVSAEFGSISGKVVDDEMAPVVGAQVALLRQDLETKTDAAGVFTFNDLAPGSYDVVVQKLGYDEDAKRVDVLADEVTELTMSVTPLLVAADPYYLAVPKVSMIQAGNAYTQLAFQQLNQSATNGLTCDVCVYIVHFAPGATATMAEAHWACSTCNAAVNNEIWYKVMSDWTTGAQLDGTVMINSYLSNREQFVYDGDDTKTVQKSKRGAILVHLGADLEGISFQHKFETIHTFAYNVEEFPDGFTSLPPA